MHKGQDYGILQLLLRLPWAARHILLGFPSNSLFFCICALPAWADVLASCCCAGPRASLTSRFDCRGSVVAIDSAVPRRDQDGNRILVDDPLMPKRRGVHPALDPAIVLELGPDRHHATDRLKPAYRPY